MKGVSETIQHEAKEQRGQFLSMLLLRNIGTHWVALYVNNNTIIYFDSFGVEHIPGEIMKFIARKKIITNIGLINFMFNGKSLTDYTNLFSPNDLKKKR